MEDFKIDLMIGEGPSARSMKINVNRFTLIGATTRTGLITSPLRSRFGLDLRLDYYDPLELFDYGYKYCPVYLIKPDRIDFKHFKRLFCNA